MLIDFLERRVGREREKKNDVREKHGSVVSHRHLDQGLNLQPKCVPPQELNLQLFGLWTTL